MKKKFHLSFLIILLLPLFSLVGNEREAEGRELVVAAVGDSITWGFAIENRLENSWPAQLQELSGGNFHVKNFGRNGRTLVRSSNKPYIETRYFEKALDCSPRIVIIALGTNDARGKHSLFLSDFVSDYNWLISRFRELESDPRIFICYPVPAFPNLWDVDISLVENTIIPLIDEVAEINDVEVIDLFSPLRNRRDLFPDGVHPDGEGAGIIAGTIYKTLSELVFNETH